MVERQTSLQYIILFDFQDEVQEKLSEKNQQLKETSRKAHKFQADLNQMLAWVNLTKEKLDGAGDVGLNKEMLNKQLKEAQVGFIK